MRLVKHRGKWAVYIGRNKRISTGHDATEAERGNAERAARDYLARRSHAIAGETCREIVAAYIADMPHRANPKAASSGTLCAEKAIAAFFGGHRPDEVTRDECRAYTAARRKAGRKDGTIRKEIGVLAAALRWQDPATPARFDMPSPPPPREHWLTREEVKAALNAASLPHIKTFLHIALCTGARKAAILEMTWETHVNFEKRTLWPGFKAGGKNRAKPIPMTEACYQWLLEAKKGAESAFVIEWAGEPVADVKHALWSVLERAGIEGVTAPAHVWRHTAGAWMAQSGVDMLEIARRLGHSSIKTTERHYAHLHPDYMGASTKALELGK